VLDAFTSLRDGGPALRLVLAPRHPERVAEVEGLARVRGFRTARRTRLTGDGPADVILLDTVGELAALYAAADVIFVGGSLVPIGGHNVIEAAVHAKPVLFGPHMGNFREAARLLLEAGGAIQLRDAAELAPAVRGLLANPVRRLALGQAARAAVSQHQGACGRTLEALEAVLEGSGVLPPRP
jgi:3-deoxy-D-manno-octulosonic-acid transferase